MTELTDVEAVARAKSGDHEAFGILVKRYQGRAFHLALRVLRDDEKARDAVQEGFLKAYNSLDRFEGRAGFYTWLYRLVFNLCIDMKRRDRPERQLEWNEQAAQQLSPAAGSVGALASDDEPERQAERSEMRGFITKAIDELPEDARRTLLLREVDGLSYAEIAKALGIPKGTVMSRLHHARRRVRELLVEAGVVEPALSGDDART